MNNDYDIIICGAGCAGLSLAYRLCHARFDDLKILIIDPDKKVQNDRTWCFWEINEGIFEPIVKKSWTKVTFKSPEIDKVLDLSPYTYKMIEGLEFYHFVKSQLKTKRNIHWIHEPVIDITDAISNVKVSTPSSTYTTARCFKNYLTEPLDKTLQWYVDQHFGGWVIKTDKPSFDPSLATFMDFQIEQGGETRFFYVLPTSDTEALVEIAIFSNNKWTKSNYDDEIKKYIELKLNIDSYQINEREYGVIPMTTYDFSKTHTSSRVIPIGTAAGAVKASSGYAFHRIQKHSDYIIQCIDKQKNIQAYFKSNRYTFYDRIMLNVILTHKVPSTQIFTKLFDNLKASSVLAFLNEELPFPSEFKIFTAPPWWPFTKAMIEELGSNQ